MNFLVDPSDVVNFNRTDHELELFWLFVAVVAGKTAKTQARLLDNFLTNLPAPYGEFNDTPFGRIHLANASGTLFEKLKESRLGQFNRLYKLFVGSLLIDLRECTVEDLEAIHGVGPKTARMFIMMSRPNQRYAALDTHILKYLAQKGHDVPKVTPTGKQYGNIEKIFLKYADESNMSVADFDLQIWKSYAK